MGRVRPIRAEAKRLPRGRCLDMRRDVDAWSSTTGDRDMSKLLDLMRKLGADAALATEYEKNKEAVIRRAGLSDEEAEALRNSDYEAIKRLTGLTDGQFATNHTVRAYDK